MNILRLREWVDLPGIGKIKVTMEQGSGAQGLRAYSRLRAQVRLGKQFRKKCQTSTW